MTISEIIGAVPGLLLYFVPGFIALLVYRKIRGDEREFGFTALVACCASYLGIVIVRAMFGVLDIVVASVYLEALTVTAVLVVCAVVFAKVIGTQWYGKLLYSLFRLSPKKDAWYNAIDVKNGTIAWVKLKNTDYWIYGCVVSFGDVTKNHWIALGYVRRCKLDTYEEIDAYEDDDETVLICIDDIELIKFVPFKKGTDKEDKRK